MQFTKSIFFRWILGKQQRLLGFTLLELLISVIVAGIVVSGLLTLVNEILQIDKRESTLDQVQRDLQRAMSYISDDLQEAVYVYPNPERFNSLLSADSDFPDTSGDTPVLAFWRLKPIENNLPNICLEGHPSYSTADAAKFAECQVLRIRQSAYSLVIYVQRVNDDNPNWSGRSRIIRYELPNYSNVQNLIETDGYRDPANVSDSEASFELWIPKPENAAGSAVDPSGSSSVLVDFIESPTATLNRSPLSDSTEPCSSFGFDADGNPEYKVVPSTATTSTNTSFFACVRQPDRNGNQRSNQDVYVFLKGNAVDGPSGAISVFSEDSALPILETRVVVRGIIDKNLE